MKLYARTVRSIGYRIHVSRLKRRIKTRRFSLITQNCIGGVIYHMLGMEFSSPTVNMFIEGESFSKLVNNLRHYMESTPEPVSDCYADPADRSVTYPLIKIDDVELCCLHYKNCAQAIEAWERRKTRIDYDNVLVIANSWNSKEDPDIIRKIMDTEYQSICFTRKDLKLENCIPLKGDYWRVDQRGMVRPNLTDFKPNSYKRYFEDYIDIAEWINTGRTKE